MLELVAHHLNQTLLQLVRAPPEFRARLPPLARQNEETEPGDQTRGEDAGDVDRDRAGRRDDQRAETDRAGFRHRDLRHRAPDTEIESSCACCSGS